jgi:hypothetical protein
MSEAQGEAQIVAVRIAAAHEGDAELIVDIRYSNGGETQVALDHFTSQALFEACGASTADDLIGHGWSKVRDALEVAYNRF